MNERTLRDRFHALGPLVLRMGIAAVLMTNGLDRTRGVFQEETVAVGSADATTLSRLVTAATPDGFHVSADWASMLGIGEILAAGLLVIGWITRLVVLPVVAVLGYGLIAGFNHQSMPTDTTSMALLAAACFSLLASGAGCMAVRRRGRKVSRAESPPALRRELTREEFVYSKPPMTQRVRNWLARKRSTSQPAVTSMGARGKRWPWRRVNV